MKKFVPFLLSASLCFAGGIPSHSIYGDYIEARTADVYTGPCFANSEAGLIGNLAVFGWKVDKGSWQGVNLDGLSVVAAVRANNTLGRRRLKGQPLSRTEGTKGRGSDPDQPLSLVDSDGGLRPQSGR